jgi:hypothetical protein
MTGQKDKDMQPYDDEEGQQPGPKRTGERLLSLLIVGTILINFPLLSVFSNNNLFLGFPVLFVYLFFVWGLIIGAMVLVLRDRPRRSSDPDSARKREER